MNTSELIYDWNKNFPPGLKPPGPVLLNDESLRDGLQSPSVRDPSIPEKIEILHLMEALGINSLDLGLPGAGPRAIAAVTALAREIAAHKMKIQANCAARTLENDIRPIAEIVQKTGLRIVNQRQFDRLTGYLATTKGTIALGGNSDASTLRLEPTVVVDPDPDEPLMSNEIFGPILPVITVQSLDEAIRFVNSRPKPLSAYLFTKTRAVRERVIKEVPAGGMLVNHLAFQVSTAKLPFGGVGASGMGAYHGRWGFDEFSHREELQYGYIAVVE